MKGQKKSQKSQRSRDVLRTLLALIPLPLALILSLFPDLGGPERLSLVPILLVFGLGIVVGTFTHTYWIRVLLKEQKFYKKFYEQNAVQPNKFDKELNIKHTRILLPFYIFGILIFILVLFVFGIFDLSLAYLLPLAFWRS